MPVVGIPLEEIKKSLGTKILSRELVKVLESLGCDVEGFAKLKRYKCQKCQNITEVTQDEAEPAICTLCGFDFREDPTKRIIQKDVEVIRMELLAVRPDIFDFGGLTRMLLGYYGKEVGLKDYDLSLGEVTVNVDPITNKKRSYRPFIVGALVRTITANDIFLKTVMTLQENLHWALGRNRKLASIGIYDLDRLTPPFTYTAFAPEALSFTPLAMKDKALTPEQILKEHPKGRAFAFLLKDFEKYPFLIDSKGKVLSMPPIINSEDSRVTVNTKNVFIDVTGIQKRILDKALNIMVCNIKEIDKNCEIEKVVIKYEDEEIVTPDFKPQEMILNCSEANKILGLSLDKEDIINLLKKMRHNAEKREDNKIRVQIPPYRNDIIHPRDLIEDIAIMHGYKNIKPRFIKASTESSEYPLLKSCNQIRNILTGLGFIEITTLMLTNPKAHYDKLNLPVDGGSVKILNPVSHDQTIIRTHLCSGILDTFYRNIHNELPQKVFEIGDITLIDEGMETGTSDYKYLAVGITSSKAGFADIKAVFEAYCFEMQINTVNIESDLELFIPGRQCEIFKDKKKIGMMGEVYPEVLERFNLLQPVVLFNLEIGKHELYL
ncbi:MAG: phenylalanine--tRNA ligase subunit beta [Thermodesulfobacteriota bacterium]|nr:phenylalanine--tRNA ligase subunit beta [Thermodesulfobacteriota bacterium]